MKRFLYPIFNCRIIYLYIFLFCCVSSGFAKIRVGAECMEKYIPLIQNKRIALVVNQTSMVENVHLLDTLLSLHVDVRKIFAPEHGFRGNIDAGSIVHSSKDEQTGIPIISIYGKTKKISSSQLEDIDIVLFDIQDVGARFYTYISTMHYVMEACAENGKRLFILDRPNPHDIVDGPVLKEKQFRSFVGMDELPILHGCTVGELACMINGEGWLGKKLCCDLQVLKVMGWKHGQSYDLPIKPSPNLPNARAIRLYPSLCLFEGTDVSVGRGTIWPFQVIGYPNRACGDFSFVPKSIQGMDSNPIQKGKRCYGIDLREDTVVTGFDLRFLLLFYTKMKKDSAFFSNSSFFDRLAGGDDLRNQIISGWSEQQIRATWQPDLIEYKRKRTKYILY